jgi:hypothetical protein
VAPGEKGPIFEAVAKDHALAKKPSPPADPVSADPDKARVALDVATVVPWIAFWGWVALDSALAYRKSQTGLDQAEESPPEPDRPAPSVGGEAPARSWSPWSAGARAAMIGAPILALLGPLVLDKLKRRRKS